ncbi:MAG: hypothetical protein RID09_11120 [Coleofasciculus sp. G1-WW12-02]|uniref:hypothetical protein n=1 Tax=unclassified Coleofasciculus TaxID=2692782 RepID=UPI0032F7991C
MKDLKIKELVEWSHCKTSAPSFRVYPENHPCNYETLFSLLSKQCKLLSQLIATSWLNGEKATQIREIFRKAKREDDSDLKDLLTGKKSELWDQPIFDETEIDRYEFEITLDSFEGSLIETGKVSPAFKMTLPYPPRPALGELTVTYAEIEEWVKEPIVEENGITKDFVPPSLYIPCSSC